MTKKKTLNLGVTTYHAPSEESIMSRLLLLLRWYVHFLRVLRQTQFTYVHKKQGPLLTSRCYQCPFFLSGPDYVYRAKRSGLTPGLSRLRRHDPVQCFDRSHIFHPLLSLWLAEKQKDFTIGRKTNIKTYSLLYNT